MMNIGDCTCDVVAFVGAGLVGLGEAVPTRGRWWLPEPIKPVAAEQEKPVASQPCTKKVALTIADFVSAFQYPPFRWLFITNVMNTVYSSFAGIFFIFWFQDEVGSNGFNLLGRHITDAPQTALAFTSTISQITGFVLTAPGGWIADKFPYNRAQLLFISALVQTLCPIANAFRPDFTWVCATTLFSGLTGGLTSTCGRSITADCVPVDPITQVPLAPARDFMVASYASILPRLVLPAILGVVFSMFENRDEAYFWFFILSAGIHAGSAFLYLVVHEKQKEAREVASGGGPEQGGAGKKPGSNVPAGAKFCDRVLFGEEVYGGSGSVADVSSFSSRSRRRSYTKELAVQRVEDYRRLEAARELQPPVQSGRYS
jgi:hypothetical protein